MGQFICHQQCWGAALHPVHLVLGKPLLRMQRQKPSWCCTYKRKVTTQQGTGSGWSPNVSQQNPQRFATDHCPQKGKKKPKTTGTRMSNFPLPLSKGRCRQDLLRFLSRQLPLELSSENLHLMLWKPTEFLSSLLEETLSDNKGQCNAVSYFWRFSHFVISFILKHPRGGFLMIRIPRFPSDGFS